MSEESQDSGTKVLIEDLEKILQNAKEFEYHDFKNRKYDAPKITLVMHLNDIATNTMNGKYD